MKRIEDFRKSFDKAIIDLDAFIVSLQDLKTMRPTEISEILKRRSGTNIEMQSIVKMIIKNGRHRIPLKCYSFIYESAILWIINIKWKIWMWMWMCACSCACASAWFRPYQCELPSICIIWHACGWLFSVNHLFFFIFISTIDIHRTKMSSWEYAFKFHTESYEQIPNKNAVCVCVCVFFHKNETFTKLVLHKSLWNIFFALGSFISLHLSARTPFSLVWEWLHTAHWALFSNNNSNNRKNWWKNQNKPIGKRI